MYLLDTNVVSEFRKAPAGRADANVTSWATGVPPRTLFLSVITLLEIETGILRIARRDEAQANVLRDWMDANILTAFEGRIFDIDQMIARRCAALHIPDPRPERDAMIAATALVHGFTVATRNVGDFAPMGVAVFNPWEPASA